MAGKANYQECARLIWESAKKGMNSEAAAAFGLLDNDDDVEDVLCTCRGNLEVIYITLRNRPWAFKHIDVGSLAELLSKQATPNYVESDEDEGNLVRV